MIPSASLNPVHQKLSDKGSPAKPEEQTAGKFMDLLNVFKQETGQDSTTNLVAMVNSLLQPTNEQPAETTKQVNLEDAKDNELTTRNDLIALVSSLAETTIDPKEKVKHLPNAMKQEESVPLEKLTNLPAEVASQAKETFHLKQKTVEGAIQSSFSLQNTDSAAPDFDFQRGVEGKEVIFQSVQPYNNTTADSKNSRVQSQKVSVDQLFTEVMDLVKNQASIKKAAEFIEAKFSLTPEKLGDIDVKLSIHKGQVLAHFTADTLLGKEALESQISQLRSSLQHQGLQVDKIEISLSGQGLHHSFSQQEGKSRQDQSQQRFAKKKISVDEFYQSHTVTEEYKQRGTENTINILA
ncbi:flagellar hook-length control protein [Neobacillus bataviensis LMG 21833]|uniref:Flagellar hook-length control protein n=1 Tax=Neobacillus bataviensis LMG 21833 TaxID=1117379 RepID=K6DV70_9BACI|nr:flagellar hook-length control protein FliK [Neobacillus bataviensis]EKN64721.1 flagellar hook-length control protein [Neobacillus bataviensis LMG 21833]